MITNKYKNCRRCLLCVTGLQILFAAAVTFAGFERFIEDTSGLERDVEVLLNEFSETKETRYLRDCVTLLFPQYQEGDTNVDWMPERVRILVLRLNALEAVYEARDWSYDLNEKERPEDVLVVDANAAHSDKEKRQMVERYKASQAKRKRELDLQKIHDRLVLDIHLYLQRVVNHPDLEVKDDIAIIHDMIESEILRNALLSELSDRDGGSSKPEVGMVSESKPFRDVPALVTAATNDLSAVQVSVSNETVFMVSSGRHAEGSGNDEPPDTEHRDLSYRVLAVLAFVMAGIIVSITMKRCRK